MQKLPVSERTLHWTRKGASISRTVPRSKHPPTHYKSVQSHIHSTRTSYALEEHETRRTSLYSPNSTSIGRLIIFIRASFLSRDTFKTMDMQQSDNTQDYEQPETPLIPPLHRRRGRKSTIADYCRENIESKKEKCIWLCIRRGRRYSLVDIPLVQNEQEIGLHAIRKRYSWWKRYSLYSAVAVKEVMVSNRERSHNSRPDKRQGSHPRL